jgi:hypothetical protein
VIAGVLRLWAQAVVLVFGDDFGVFTAYRSPRGSNKADGAETLSSTNSSSDVSSASRTHSALEALRKVAASSGCPPTTSSSPQSTAFGSVTTAPFVTSPSNKIDNRGMLTSSR